MRKLLKAMFSQLVIVSILLILQVAVLLWFIFSLSDYVVYIDLILKLISMVVVIYIMNHHSNPMYKLAWVIPILLFPIIGGLFYLFITCQMHTRFFFARIKNISDELTSKYPQSKAVLSQIAQTHPERESTVRYINKTSGFNAYECFDATYFATGEEKLASLLIELEKAEKYIFLEYFILNDGVMWQSIFNILKRKAAEGVDVRILYDGMGSMTLLPRSFPKEMQKHNIKCHVFSPFVPFLAATQNNRDHRKILVIDGKVAYTGGVNISDEYINATYRFGHWKDMSVCIKGPAAFSFTLMFLEMWSVTTRKKEDPKQYEPVFDNEFSNPKGYVMSYADVPQDRYQIGKYIYLDIINKAKKYVHITTPYLILDHEMIVALTNAALSGVDVRIICPAVADHWYARSVAYSYYKELMECGVKIYEYSPGFIHGKTFCSDDSIAVVGSINLDYRSLYLHFECAAWFLDCPTVLSVADDFNRTLKKCRQITLLDCKKRSFIKKITSAVLRIFAPLM